MTRNNNPAAELATQEAIIEKHLAHNRGTATTLSPGERERLAKYVEVVDQGMNSFLLVGAALLGIREGKLYRETHDSFEAFCKEKWLMSRPRAYQLIAATRMVNRLAADLSTTVDKPTSERQVRPLAALPPEQQTEAWQEAVDTAPEGKPTAKHVQKIVDRIKPVVDGKTMSERERLKRVNALLGKFSHHAQGLTEATFAINKFMKEWPRDISVPVWPQPIRKWIAMVADSVTVLNEDVNGTAPPSPPRRKRGGRA